ncbi:hypothetical protein [Solibacillus cecembensis]|uniref:hypothetical protein n=1 Tax=Solibacillus cecembensis TaxID=459347 RepID=UPI003D06E92B
MKKYFYISILLGSLVLSGCINDEADNTEPTAESLVTERSKIINEEDNTKMTEEVKEVGKKEPVILDVTDMEKVAPIRGFYPIAIDSEITSPIGQSESYFTHLGDSPFKITLSNIGTESFLYKIQNLDKETNVARGILKSNESYEKIFDGFAEGAYLISYLVEEEGYPMDIKLKVKVKVEFLY